MSDERDLLIARVRETLRADPAAAPEPRAVAQVLQAVWQSPRPSLWQRAVEAWRGAAVTPARATGLAAVALLLGFVTRGVVVEPAAPAVAARPAGSSAFPAQRVADVADGLVQTQFVYDGKAESVSLVGDFNDWQGGVTPLDRLETGVWTVTVPLPPGRHVYAFLIDGTLVVADPRAPKSGDADYGQEGSVVMVFAR